MCSRLAWVHTVVRVHCDSAHASSLVHRNVLCAGGPLRTCARVVNVQQVRGDAVGRRRRAARLAQQVRHDAMEARQHAMRLPHVLRMSRNRVSIMLGARANVG